MAAVLSTDNAQSGWLKYHITGDATGAAHTWGSFLNPEGVLLHIYEGYLYRSTAAADAATIDIGIGATGAQSTDLCSAVAINATGMIKIVGTDLASEGAATTPRGLLWASTTYLNFWEQAAQASTLFVGDLYLHYIRLA
jgi:hypothetical protein